LETFSFTIIKKLKTGKKIVHHERLVCRGFLQLCLESFFSFLINRATTCSFELLLVCGKVRQTPATTFSRSADHGNRLECHLVCKHNVANRA